MPDQDTKAIVRHLAHELRQPLSTIESLAYYLQIVLNRADSRVIEHLEKLQEVVQQASWILSDAVHYLQAVPPFPQVIDLNEFVSEGISEWDRNARAPMRADLAMERVLVLMDADQTRHLLRNVLFFIRHIANAGSRIWVRTNVTRGEAHLELNVESVDFPLEELEQMFEPFSSHLPAGSGLALASTKQIVEAQEGRVEIHSGPGGMFTLLIAIPEAH